MRLARSRPLLAFLGVLLLASSLVALAVSPAQARSHSPVAAAAVAKTVSAHILVTPKGRTLYVFAADPQNKSTCYTTYANFWPPRLVTSSTPPTKVAGVPGTFGVITRTDGTKQLTYEGAPLYTFLNDKKAGDMNGQGVLASGGYWWAVVAAGH